MQFLSPIAFLAVAGLAIPLIIHLWNVKQGKTLKIGSISLLGESAQQSARSFKITDWFLLILRCLLLVLLAALLAGPYFRQMSAGKAKGGWILVDQRAFPQVFKAHSKEIKSLIQKGYELRDFNLGFTKILLKDSLKTDVQKRKDLPGYTDLLQQLNEVVPPGDSIYLFADRRLKHFGSQLPEVHYVLHWVPVVPADTSGSWISDFAGKKYRATSDTLNTTYQVLEDQKIPELSVLIEEGPGIQDAKYLEAALQSISTFTGRTIRIQHWPAEENTTYDALFWLSDENLPNNALGHIKTHGLLFNYPQGKIQTTKSILLTGQEANPHIQLFKRVNVKSDPGKAVWTDGFGQPILSIERTASVNHYRFYSRLNPQWNELVWNENFVKALMPIVIGSSAPTDFGFENHPNDQRFLSVSQQTNIYTPAESRKIKADPVKSLEFSFWIAAFLIFALERILSFRKKPTAYVKN